MKKTLMVIGICSLALMTTACGKDAKLKNGEEVVASIDGKKITADDLYEELKKSNGTAAVINELDKFIAEKEITDRKSANEYADSQLEQMKLQYEQSGQDFAAALTSSGYANEEAFKEVLVLDYKKQQVVKNFLKDELKEDEIEKYYDEEVFGEMSARHILIKVDVKDDASDDEKAKAEEAALKKAKDLIKKLDDGEDFAKLAKENSEDDGTKEDGGLLSNFTKDSVVSEFWDATYKLKKNKYTKTPVKSEYGYHIILKTNQKDKPKLKDVKDEIKADLVTKKLEEDTTLSDKTWDRIRKEKYNLKISDKDINSSYKSTIKSLDQ